MTYDTRGRPTESQDRGDQPPPPPPPASGEGNEMMSADDQLVVTFPESKLKSLIVKISNPRWVVPVLPEQELECLLNAAIELTQAGIDHECDACVRFYREGLTVSFVKILTDEAVNSWKYNIHFCILMSCGKLMQLCALHIKRDNHYLLDLLAIALDPDNKFHTYNATRQPDSFTSRLTNGAAGVWGILEENHVFGKPPKGSHSPRGWLVDLINRFGQFGGFENLLERFNTGVAYIKKVNATEENTSGGSTSSGVSATATTQSSLSVSDDSGKLMKTSSISLSTGGSTSTSNVSSMHSDDCQKMTLKLVNALLRPFGQCHEILCVSTIEKYFLPMFYVVVEMLNGLSDDELKREAKPEGRCDAINSIVKSTRCLASRLPNQETLIGELEMFRLKMILRQLKVSSFNGKMSALNDINKMLSAVGYYPHRPQGNAGQSDEEMDWLTAERMAGWIKESNVLAIVLRDSLHQPQYVEKLEKILRFLIKEKALTLDDLDEVWKAQAGKHEAIVKNVHDLLAKLAWDFNPEQLDHLFESFQASMTTANKRQRERLLELIRRLAEDDKNGVMAQKVLRLFWTLAHSAEIQQEVMDQALAAHVKILDYSCSQERDAQKTAWLNMCVDELRNNDNWALPSLRLIREICCLYEATPSHVPRNQSNLNRQQVIERLQNEHSLVILVTNSLCAYLDRVRALVRENPDVNSTNLILDGRYRHQQQIQERLDFLKFLLKDGQLWLCADQAKQIWQCLAVNAAFPSDREECFRWFGKLMGDEPDLDPGINKDFFENNLLQLDPQLLTESGIKCFERFFKAVNSKEEKLKAKHRGYILDDEDLIGKDYLWRVITTGGEDIAYKAIELLKEVSTALGPRLQANVAEFHENFIGECCERLRAHHDNILVLSQTIEEAPNNEDKDGKDAHMRFTEAEKMCRVIRVLQEYIKECDRTFNSDRIKLPLCRAARGKHIVLYIRFQNPGRPIDDIEIVTHNNETVNAFKRNLLKRIKSSTIQTLKIDLYYSTGELIEISDDRNPLSQYTIRDKMMLTVKLTHLGPGISSSPESSSESSTGSPPRPCPELVRPDTECTLPGVIISLKQHYIEFFLKLYQLGSDLKHGTLRDTSRLLLQLIPCDSFTVRQLYDACHARYTADLIADEYENTIALELRQTPTADQLLLHATPASVLYNLEVLYAILIPAADPLSENSLQMQLSWIHSGCAHLVLELLTKNNFLSNADMHTKRAAFQYVLRLAKLFLYIVGCVLSKVGTEPSSTANLENGRSQIELLKQALTSIFGGSEHTLRAIAVKLADNLATEMLSAGPEGEQCRTLFGSALLWSCPDLSTIKAIVSLAWAAACGKIHQLGTCSDFSQQESGMPESVDFSVCKVALEVLTISLVLNPEAQDALSKDAIWSKFIRSLVLINPSRHIRQVASEQLFLMCTYCAADWRPFSFMIKLLVVLLQTNVPTYSTTCAEFFQLLCRSLSYGCLYNWPLSVNDLLKQEILVLRNVCNAVKETGEQRLHEDLLEGHLGLAKELMFYLNPEMKAKHNELIVELVDDFLFPASRQYITLCRTARLTVASGPPPVCRSPHTIAAACDLLVALSQNCVPNMKLLVNTLLDMFCSENEPLKEWDYLPPVGPRPAKGFCGLKNAGATCYMNSVLQQLFMVIPIRNGILSATGAATDPDEDFSGDHESLSDAYNAKTNRRHYHVGILKHVQAIFAHLGHSALQYYVPRGLWTHFKLQGEPVNLREQQDAVEFFMSLFESLDEGLKALGHPQLMGATLGGCFSDQKICQECPHRYFKEEPFSVFSVDIRNHSSLTESLEQYVKGELLEGADAYHCDKCDKKVVTVKRLCVRKLPPVLAFQLKRFEYDYERVCAIKFNDYFEFPRVLDMEPYTVFGLAKIENEVIEIDEQVDDKPPTTTYQLSGIVVHSGQASGGHYFSFILHRDPITGREQWYKFDDGEVTECKMNDDEELKAQCFGGDYMGEVYDNQLKRMQYRRQKRWWNAYMLFYTRCDQIQELDDANVEQLSLAESRSCVLPMPDPIERSVRNQNIRFLHSRSLFSPEFFNFVRKLVNCCVPVPRTDVLSPQADELSLLGVQLASQFLFYYGFRTKKTLRGAAIDWYEALCQHIRQSSGVRRWFAKNCLLTPPTRLSEYILVAQSPEVRSVFVKLVVFFCHFALNDDPVAGFEGDNLGEQILIAVLQLLKGDVSDNGKHLPHYFSLFTMYAGLGTPQKLQLLKLNVPAIFMQVSLDEGPGPPIKYQYPEINKLHQVVSQLVRCSDVSARCRNSSNTPGLRPLPNIYADPDVTPECLLPLSAESVEYLYGRTSYVKKLIEDVNAGEEGLKLLQYCSWENPHFSRAVLTELLWQCGFAYWHDMRHHTEMLLNILLMEDSWQGHRIMNALMGVAEEREGLLDTIQRAKIHYQKRAYQIIKCLVQLFRRSRVALDMLNKNPPIGRQWTMAVEWLQDELFKTRTGGSSGQYNYNWSPPAQSNDSTNGYMLERSPSANNTLKMAFLLCPEAPEDPNDSDGDHTDEMPSAVAYTKKIMSMEMVPPSDEDTFTSNVSSSGGTTSTPTPPFLPTESDGTVTVAMTQLRLPQKPSLDTQVHTDGSRQLVGGATTPTKSIPIPTSPILTTSLTSPSALSTSITASTSSTDTSTIITAASTVIMARVGSSSTTVTTAPSIPLKSSTAAIVSTTYSSTASTIRPLSPRSLISGGGFSSTVISTKIAADARSKDCATQPSNMPTTTAALEQSTTTIVTATTATTSSSPTTPKKKLSCPSPTKVVSDKTDKQI